MNVVTAEGRSRHIAGASGGSAARRGQWRWLAAGLVLAFAIPFVLTDVDVGRPRPLLRRVRRRRVRVRLGLAALRGRGAARPADAPLAQRDRRRTRVRRGDGLDRPARAGDRAPERPGVRGRDRLAGRGLRVRRRRDSLRVPDRRRLLRVRREARARAAARQGSPSAPSRSRSRSVHGRLPPRLLRLPRREAAQAAGRGRDLEHPDPRDAEPPRLADHARGAARQRGRPQLRHGHVPATASVVGGRRRPELQAILDSLVVVAAASRPARPHTSSTHGARGSARPAWPTSRAASRCRWMPACGSRACRRSGPAS